MESTDIQEIGDDLLTAAVEATPGWVRRCVGEVVAAQALGFDEQSAAFLDDASARATRFVESHLGDLLRTDIDRQRTTPLAVFRDAVRFPVEVLHELGATPVHRGDVSRWAFPNDPFGITPSNLADIGDDVHRAGIVWGAAKAGLHLQRRRDEGLR